MKRGWLFAGAAVVVLALVAILFIRDAQTPIAPVAQPLTHTFDQSPTSFTLKYPDDWQYTYPAQGVFVLAPLQQANDTEIAPTFTVQRAEPLSVVGTLDKALDRYLQNGPLYTPGRWTITTPIHTIQFEGRDARQLELEGSDTANGTPLHTSILITVAKDTFVYVIVTTEPVSKRANFDPTLDAMLASVQILE